MTHSTAAQQALDALSRAKHRRERRWRIAGPLLLAALPPAALLVLMAFAFTSAQTTTVTACMSVLVLVPLIVVLFILQSVVIAMVFGVGRVYGGTSGLLRRARYTAHTFSLGVTRLSRLVARPVIAMSTRLAWLERAAGRTPPPAFLLPSAEENTEEA